MSPFTPALRLHDRYVLRERIGLGGMSEVWRADDEVLHRPVAVKALAGQLAADPQLRAVIQREARAAARLTHPHVTQVYDYGEATLDSGVVVPYLVMELVEGQTLADRLAGGPLAWPDAVRTAGQVAGALAAAHRIGVVHRDVKPANVMLTETGAKVLDFGIAAPAGPHPVTGHTGVLLMGTPAYFAPERLDPGPANPAGDVYALGVLLYRSLTGRAPLPVRSWDDVLEVRRNRPPVPPPRVSGLPPEIADLVLACLAADPERRPTAARLAERLGAGRPADPPTAILPTVAPVAHPPTLVERVPTARPVAPERPVPPPRPAVSSNRLFGLLVAGAVVLLLAVVGSLLWSDGSGAPPAAAPTAGPSTRAADPPAPRPSSAAPPSTAPEPVTLRQLGDRFGELLDRAESIGLIDGKTADDLRKKAAELDRGKPKDRDKRVEDLREKIEDAAEDDKIDGVTAAGLRKLLDGYERLRGGDEG
ncbi:MULTISPECIES: serine/threonine-protein kinase [unclassified Micromonospora]|uniref:serine/threonine-protein kinase n=1 Tax=unclassified Micromonospora TaxID=2617518 RepID=UPI001B3969DD|nr:MULTISPECIES: serine/threonine-protein kinase [unclassified Micromonospora]MBQ1041236.1 serine/threonine protein kinase [Micromonospora sp. C72]MBQ1054964.1 serine/threonine protein kinase [Micromonospora sp. C32]